MCEKYLNIFFISVFLMFTVYPSFGQAPYIINNPVLPGVADAGVFKFNGEYYIGGVFTNGSFYVSKDLVEWEGPVHVFSMDNDWTAGASAGDNQIHANDIKYINGIFNMYWSVNYWGKDKHVVHIGHATSSKVLGPYKEPVTDTWMDNRIDPHLFMDKDGKLYMYMVKFTDGNTIWVRPMKDPGTFSGDPKYLFAALPHTWETLDNKVAEGPWVINYRNKYYMMYNANHTSPRWGNYTLGVAEADGPMDFNNGNKYPYPVVKSNQLDMEDNFVDLLKYSTNGADDFNYALSQPQEDWTKINFNAFSWQKGKTSFGATVIENSTVRNVKTKWESPEIWVRKDFTINKKEVGNLMLRIHHDGATKVFLNGQQLYFKKDRQYVTWNFDKKAKALLKDGENLLAIHSEKGEWSNFLDVSLFDMKDQVGDDVLYSPGQPNIVKGPNGFEWWLVYMANKNADRRGQYIDRVHFFDRTLHVDGITSTHTPGYHPEPSRPTFSDLFNEADDGQLQSKWDIKGGNWSIVNKEIVQKDNDAGQALIKSMPATHYLFETGVKIMDTATKKAGIYAWWKDEQNWLKVILDQEHKQWAYVANREGKSETYSFPLPEEFNYNVYHNLRVYKNSAGFTVEIDDIPAPESPFIAIDDFSGKGIPGLYTEGKNTAFDGVLYTIGWDEFDDTITGWGASERGIMQKGDWVTLEKGISPRQVSGESVVFKGDMLEEYEFSLQVIMGDDEGNAGVYAAYVDEKNYLKSIFDIENKSLVVSGKKNGKIIKENKIPLKKSQSYYADRKYTDFIEKHFTFNTPTYINAIKLNKSPYDQPDIVIENIHQKMELFYKQGDKWHPLTYNSSPSEHPGFDKIIFEPVKVEGLKFVNKQADDLESYVYKIWVDELFKQSYNLRVVKYKEEIIYLIDGKEVLRTNDKFPVSQVGLITDNIQTSFNGITLFDISNKPKP